LCIITYFLEEGVGWMTPWRGPGPGRLGFILYDHL